MLIITLCSLVEALDLNQEGKGKGKKNNNLHELLQFTILPWIYLEVNLAIK